MTEADRTADFARRLAAWLESHVVGWKDVDVKAPQLLTGSGFSAEITSVEARYRTEAGLQSQELIVRGQPQNLEVVLGSSLVLQGRMLAALHARGDMPVPPWIGMELDAGVLGIPFLVMGKVEGSVATSRPNYNVVGWLAEMTPAQRAQTWKNGIEAFARLSQIDWQDGFEFLARPEWGRPGLDQYIGHLSTWHAEAGKGRLMPYVDTALDFVKRNRPSDTPVNVLWGDPTPSNIIFGRDGRVNALIDWELAALGPAGLDLAWWLYFDDLFSRRFKIERLAGLPTRAESIAIWENAVGRRAQHMDYYDIVVALRMALVVIGAFDRQVAIGNIPSSNKSLNENLMTLYLAEKLEMPLPELGPDFYAFMSNLTPVEERR